MTIQVGDNIPTVFLKQLTLGGSMEDISTDTVFGGKKVMLFAVPGAFTPTCSAKHLPSYIQNLDKFKANDIEVVCMAVNDPFVMKKWGEASQADGITMLPDGNGTFTKALGLELDGTGHGLGNRCQRFALYVEDGIVKHVAIEKPGAFDVSSAEAMLTALHMDKAAA
jgi:peroxiredoxin